MTFWGVSSDLAEEARVAVYISSSLVVTRISLALLRSTRGQRARGQGSQRARSGRRKQQRRARDKERETRSKAPKAGGGARARDVARKRRLSIAFSRVSPARIDHRSLSEAEIIRESARCQRYPALNSTIILYARCASYARDDQPGKRVVIGRYGRFVATVLVVFIVLLCRCASPHIILPLESCQRSFFQSHLALPVARPCSSRPAAFFECSSTANPIRSDPT